MKNFISSIILAILPCLCHAKGIIVVDSTDLGPVAGTTIISSNGLILGVTDNNGHATVNEHDYPLSIRSLGYESAFIDDIGIDSIPLTPAIYSLQEVVVDPKDRPITRVLAYVREYSTGATIGDTLQMYSEYMREYFFADGKVKGYDKSHRNGIERNVRRYGRIADANGLDSVMRPKYDDDITSLSFADFMTHIPFKQIKEPDIIKSGKTSADTVSGKYYPRFIYRKTNNHFFMECDALSNHKGHKWSPLFFKILGMTMDFQKANWSLVYKSNNAGKYSINDFIFSTYNLNTLGKGKLLRKIIGVKDYISIDCYIELYPVKIERLTQEEYNEVKQEYYTRKSEFMTTDNLMPLPPSIQGLIDRIEREVPINE